MGLSWNLKIKKIQNIFHEKQLFLMNHFDCGSLDTLSQPLTFWHKQVDPSGCYDNLVTVRSFVPHYHLAGGVNLPKIIDCVGSDGAKRRQLVKVGGVSTCVDVPLCSPPPATPQFFSTPGETFTNSWSCCVFGHKGKVWRANTFLKRRHSSEDDASLCLPRHLSDN